MKLALSLALAAAAVSSVAANFGSDSCIFEHKYRWEPTRKVRIVNATGPNGPFCSPSAVGKLMEYTAEFGQMTGTDMSEYTQPINAELDQSALVNPFFLQYPYLLDVEILIFPGLRTPLFTLADEKVKADLADWVSKGGRVVYTGGSQVWQDEASRIFQMASSNMIGFSHPVTVAAPDDQPAPYYLNRGDVGDTPLCSDVWALPVLPFIPGTSPLANAFTVNGSPVSVQTNDQEQSGFYFFYTGEPNMNFTVSDYITTVVRYAPPNEEGFGDMVYIGYDYEPREVQGDAWEMAQMGYRNLLALALWSDDKEDEHQGGACGPPIQDLYAISDQYGNMQTLTFQCGGDSTFLPGMPMEQCDMLRMRVPEGYPPHMQVEMYRVPFTNSPGPLMPGHMCNEEN